MRVAAIIAAGGRGERLGAGRPKQLLDIGGTSILDMAVGAFLSHPRIDHVVIVVPADLVATVEGAWRGRVKPVAVVAGGMRRQDSVAAGFAAIADDADMVVVHDAARPFVS
ncbi:MAG: 2-C-methyl-D-erythritol 4-phosphate cytidylyltransferase, partial [Vicinamibacterales bacterium]|nr:2-C-methyl-D-erythritol 4-phosphate cytidylyltransferase [Vicinamibacterales bacterium]